MRVRERSSPFLLLALLALASLHLGGCGTTPEPVASATESPATTVATAGSGDWCAGHGVPESSCTLCNPHLIPQFKAAGDWCAAHNLPESVCPQCNPGGAAPVADWCTPHAIPESMCTVCNPGLVAKFQAAGDWCAEHGYPESACPKCNPMPRPAGMAAPTAIAPGTKIRFRSAEFERASGIDVVAARAAAIDLGIECTARLEFDRNRVGDVRASMPGVVRDVLVDLGQTVEQGTALFRLSSPRVGDLQAQLRSARQRVTGARANHARQEELREPQIASARQLELASQELEAAESELRALESALGIAGAAAASKGGVYTVAAPRAGTVVRRPATVGTFATEETSLATVADTTVMWAMLEVRDADAGALELGQEVTIDIGGASARSVAGTITWISAEVDPRTRTVAARAEIANPDGRLRANQFVRASFRVSAPHSAVAVPRASVQRLGEENVVFVRTGEGLYEPRAVTLGRVNRELAQVVGAVQAGEQVVAVGAFLLKTELSKESIGAGCCEVEAPGS